MLTDWKIGQKTDINPDGVETTVVMAFTSLDGSHAAYSMSPHAARAMADELADNAEDIEPAPVEKRRFPLGPAYMGYAASGLLWALADTDWLRTGLSLAVGAVGFWLWRRDATR